MLAWLIWSSIAFLLFCVGLYVLMFAIQEGIIIWRKR